MSNLYLVRHGQAGTRENYDSLSPLGRKQAQNLRDYFASQNLTFDQVYAGSLKRQRATALEVLPNQEPQIDQGWDEFDLAQVYSEYAPHLSADDEDFRREYEEMQLAIQESQGAHGHPVHRRWTDCDKKIIRAWIDSRYDFSGEPWPHFVSRIHAALDRVTHHEGNTIVFTSATPIGVCAARTFDLIDNRAMIFASVLMNASFTVFRVRSEEIRLFSLNNGPHLTEPDLRTFR
jgi:broad specificity phosphatase PhoE